MAGVFRPHMWLAAWTVGEVCVCLTLERVERMKENESEKPEVPWRGLLRSVSED